MNVSEIVEIALDAADPVRAVKHALRDAEISMMLESPGDVYVVGMGKASERMSFPVIDLLGDRIAGGCIAVPKSQSPTPKKMGRIRVCPAGHPVPDEGSLEAGEEILRITSEAGEGDLVVALVSGGGSALAEKPLDGISLDDLVETNRLLLSSGASINEINTVRKHLSMVKGGRLAVSAWPARVLSFIVSDVPGDRVDMIASGPTVADPTTFSDALEIVERYGLTGAIPSAVLDVLHRGARGLVEETPKPGDPRLSRTVNKVVLKNMDVLEKVEGYLREMGFNTIILTSRLEGESREVARVLASIALEILDRGIPVDPPAAVIVGGETTVTVRNAGGRGGRNTELALAWALSVRYWGGGDAILVAFDTDGIDGNSDAAGAIAWPGLVDVLYSEGLDPWVLLEENRSYEALSRAGALLVTGPTGTNVNSVAVMLVGASGVLGWRHGGQEPPPIQ